MSAFDSALTGLNAACLRTFGISASLVPQDGSGAIAITGIIKAPAMDEPAIPGSAKGVSVVRFWVDLNTLSKEPKVGDTVSLNGVTYDLYEVAAEYDGGGALLRLRRNA